MSVSRDDAPEQNRIRSDASFEAMLERILARAARTAGDAAPVEAPLPAPEQSAREVRLKWSIPRRHHANTLDNYRPQNRSQRQALVATKEWVEQVCRGEGVALALVGGVGTGKSHLMYAAIRELIMRDVNAGAWGWFDLAQLLREAKYDRGDDGYPDARRQRERLLSVRAFGLDEIRPTAGTEFDTTELSQLMTRAYRECQGVIVTSNFADEGLARIIGLAAQDRLTPVQLEGESFRHQHLRARRSP